MLVICSIPVTTFATAVPVSIKFTSDALGLGSDNINDGKDGMSIGTDFAGKLETSTVTGEGSFLYIQQDGLAGLGSTDNPLFVTVTAKNHLDTPGPGDWNAGVLYISKEYTGGGKNAIANSKDKGKGKGKGKDKSKGKGISKGRGRDKGRCKDRDRDKDKGKDKSHSSHLDGYKEGLGVRAFTVDPAGGLRIIDPATGRARIEGSKHVSGGTETFDSWDDITLVKTKDGVKNGPPHVDELVRFDFANPVAAQSVVVRFSDFLSTDVIDLSIEVIHQDGSTETLTDNWLDTVESPLVIAGIESDKLCDLIFANIAGLSDTDLITSFDIRAIDDNPLHPRETAEHFYITAISASVVPEPATITLLGMGFLSLFRRRRK